MSPRLVLLGYGIFAFSGFNTTLLSNVAPRFAGKLPDSAIGSIFAAQYLGQLLGPLFLFGRPIPALLGGLALSAFCAMYFVVSGHLAPLALSLYGLGLGTVMAATNVFVGAVSDEPNRKSRIERLNFFWPLSALVAPFVLRHTPLSGLTAPFLLVAINSVATLLLVAIVGYRFGFLRLNTESGVDGLMNQKTTLAVLCALAMLACGVEAALFSWAPIFSSRFSAHTNGMELGVAAFWAGLLSGRLSASFLFAKGEVRRVTAFASLLCACAIALLALGAGELAMTVALFVAGVSISSIYPALISDALPLRGSQFVFVSAGIGSAALPWLTGRLSTAEGSLRWGQGIPGVACVVLGCGYFILQKRLRTQTKNV